MSTRISQRRWIDLPGLLLVGLGTVIAIWNFWQPGISSAADMLLGIYRVFELDQAWRHHIFFPRLGINLNFTYTAPLFQFYPPLVSYVAVVFHWAGFGLVEATKIVFSLSLFLAGLGTYGYAHWLFGNRRAALVSAVAYQFAPYLLCNIYERGAAAETGALALLPWTAWIWHRLLEEQKARWFWLAAFLLALLVLAHNITALFSIPFILIHLVVLIWKRKGWGTIPLIGLALILGLGQSAFYWFPALGERGYVQIESTMLGEGMRPEDNLVTSSDLISSDLAFDYWGPQRFRLSLWQAVLGTVAMVGIAVQTGKLRSSLIVLAGVVIILLALQLKMSSAFWLGISLVRFIQYPWRLLGIASFCIALLIGALLCWKRLAGPAGGMVMVFLIILMGIASLYRLSPSLSRIWYGFSSSQVSREDLFERGRFGFGLFSDYSPIWMRLFSQDLAKPRADSQPTLLPLSIAPAVQVIEASPFHVRLQVKTDVPFPLRLHRLYFPGWQTYVNGQAISTRPDGDLGLVTADLPAGEYEVVTQFEETPLRRMANSLSLLALLVSLVGLLLRHSRLILLVIVVAMFLFAIVFRQIFPEPLTHPLAYAANLQDEIHLLGYYLPKSEYHPGDTLTLKLYWLTQQTPQDDYTVFLHLVQPDGSKVGQGDNMPIHGYSFTSRWEPGELVEDEQQMYLDDQIPVGTYQLLMGMYSLNGGNLRVHQAPHVLPGDRIILTQIEVRGK